MKSRRASANAIAHQTISSAGASDGLCSHPSASERQDDAGQGGERKCDQSQGAADAVCVAARVRCCSSQPHAETAPTAAPRAARRAGRSAARPIGMLIHSAVGPAGNNVKAISHAEASRPEHDQADARHLSRQDVRVAQRRQQLEREPGTVDRELVHRERKDRQQVQRAAERRQTLTARNRQRAQIHSAASLQHHCEHPNTSNGDSSVERPRGVRIARRSWASGDRGRARGQPREPPSPCVRAAGRREVPSTTVSRAAA